MIPYDEKFEREISFGTIKKKEQGEKLLGKSSEIYRSGFVSENESGPQPTRFDAILERRLELSKKTLGSKKIEYASDKSRYHNFQVAAKVDNETPGQALWGMAKKHLVSIIDMKNDYHIKKYSVEHIEEKIGDMINYLILLEGILKENVTE